MGIHIPAHHSLYLSYGINMKKEIFVGSSFTFLNVWKKKCIHLLRHLKKDWKKMQNFTQ